MLTKIKWIVLVMLIATTLGNYSSSARELSNTGQVTVYFSPVLDRLDDKNLRLYTNDVEMSLFDYSNLTFQGYLLYQSPWDRSQTKDLRIASEYQSYQSQLWLGNGSIAWYHRSFYWDLQTQGIFPFDKLKWYLVLGSDRPLQLSGAPFNPPQNVSWSVTSPEFTPLLSNPSYFRLSAALAPLGLQITEMDYESWVSEGVTNWYAIQIGFARQGADVRQFFSMFWIPAVALMITGVGWILYAVRKRKTMDVRIQSLSPIAGLSLALTDTYWLSQFSSPFRTFEVQWILYGDILLWSCCFVVGLIIASNRTPSTQGVSAHEPEGSGQTKSANEIEVKPSESEMQNVFASVWPAGSSALAIVNNIQVGTLLTGSTDDLIFTIKTAGATFWNTIAVYVPPGFSIPWAVSQMSNERPRIQVLEASRDDQHGPGWGVVYVSADTTTFGDAGISPEAYDNPVIVVASDKEGYSIRIKGVTAPSVAGRYFFKIALFNSEKSYGISGKNTNDSVMIEQQATHFIPPENWPVLLVKGEVTPALITGTLRYARYNASLDGLPIEEAGKVWAKMTTRLDPYTGAQRPDLPTVDAQAYLSAAAHGRYELGGLAPGVYDIYASATGYPQLLCQSGITVLKGQSLHFDCYLRQGPVIRGDVSTKLGSHNNPWPEDAYVKIELYEAPTLGRIPDPSARLVSWSPSRVAGRQKAFDKVRRPQDVGPPQDWFVRGGTTIPFHFEFGEKGVYGAPRDLDGMVPQIYATWVNGLTPGRYYARAWVSRYNQSAADGSTFQEYSFQVTPNKYDDVTMVISLRSS